MTNSQLKRVLIRALNHFLDEVNPHITIGDLADTFVDIQCDLIDDANMARPIRGIIVKELSNQ